MPDCGETFRFSGFKLLNEVPSCCCCCSVLLCGEIVWSRTIECTAHFTPIGKVLVHLGSWMGIGGATTATRSIALRCIQTEISLDLV